MRPFGKKTEPKKNPADIGRTSPPTPKQAKRYNDLRNGGASPLEAARTVRAEAARNSRS